MMTTTPPAAPPSREWLTTEVATLRALYPDGGAQAVQEALPGRTLAAIRAKACQLGVACQRPPPIGRTLTRKYPRTDEIDHLIRAGYAAARAKGDYTRLAHAIDRPRWWVQKRAMALGVTRSIRTRLDVWTGAETALLSALASCTTPVIRRKLVEAGYQRTEAAIACKLKRLNVDRTDPDSWAPPELAHLMGVNAKTICDWIERRDLPATRVTAGQQVRYRVHRQPLRKWLRARPLQIDLRRVDQLWFMDLVLG